jgi:hypothetical protein
MLSSIGYPNGICYLRMAPTCEDTALDLYPDGPPDDGYNISRGQGVEMLRLAQDVAFEATEKEVPDIMKAIGKPQLAGAKVRLEAIDDKAIAEAVKWNQPDRKQWVDDYDWEEIWSRYSQKPNKFGVAVWVDGADGKSTLAGMAAGSIFDDREPKRLDIDYIESPLKTENPIPGATRFLVVAAGINTTQAAQLNELRFVDTNPGSEALFKAMGFEKAAGVDEIGYEYMSMKVEPSVAPVQQMKYGKPDLSHVPKV